MSEHKILDLKCNTILPEFCYLIKDEEDYKSVKGKIRHLQRWAKTQIDDSKMSIIAFRVNNWACNKKFPELKEGFLNWWKSSHNGIDYPYPDLIKPIDAKIVAAFWIQELPDIKFDVDENFKLVNPFPKKGEHFFYEGMHSVDLLSYALNKNDCTIFDDDFIRFHKTYYKSKVYKEGSEELIDIVYRPGDFEFAIDPIELRRKDLQMMKQGV